MINKNVKYRDILIFALIGVIGYKFIDNYDYFFGILRKLMSILSPFIYALICAYILNPIVKLFENKFKFKRGMAIFITYAIIASLVTIALLFTIPSIIDSIASITKDIPIYMETVQGWIDAVLKNDKLKEMITEAGFLSKLEDISIQIGNFTILILQNSVTYLLSFTTGLVKGILGFLIAIYVLIDKERLLCMCRTITYIIFKEKKGKNIIHFVNTYNMMIGTYIGIKAIDSLIIGFIALIGLSIVGAPYYLILAIVVGVTNMIPYFGPLVGEIVGATVTLFVSPIKAIVVFLLLLAIQQFDAWYLEPKLIGDKVGIRPFGIIVAVVLAGGFFGPIGMLLGSPTLATIKIYYDKIVERFREENKELVKKEKLDLSD